MKLITTVLILSMMLFSVIATATTIQGEPVADNPALGTNIVSKSLVKPTQRLTTASISISPPSQTVKRGSSATFKVLVKDLRSLPPEWSKMPIKLATYDISIGGLENWRVNHKIPSQVQLGPGQQIEYELTIDTIDTRLEEKSLIGISQLDQINFWAIISSGGRAMQSEAVLNIKDTVDTVSLSISPPSQTVKKGDTAVYEVTVKDNRNPLPEGSKMPIIMATYKLSVQGLYYSTSGLPDKVELGPGEKAEYKLYVDTSSGLQLHILTDQKQATVSKSFDQPTASNLQVASYKAVSEESQQVQYEIEQLKSETVEIVNFQIAVQPLYIDTRYRETYEISVESAELDIISAEQDYTIHISKGWNLVSIAMFGVDGSTAVTPIDVTGIKLYSYFPLEKKYGSYRLEGDGVHNRLVGITKEDQMLLEKYFNGDTGYLVSTPANSWWAYSPRDFTITAELSPDFAEVIRHVEEKNLKLAKGWNFIMISPDMAGHTVAEFTGDSVSRAYVFDSERQEWTNIKDTQLTKEMVGYGMILKAEKELVMGFGSGITPPPLP